MTRTFAPRAPTVKLEEEDQQIPRICFSHTILGCINAIPSLERHLKENWSSRGAHAKAILFSVDTGDYPDLQFIDSNELYERGLVPDAIVNQECWCMGPVTMTGHELKICESSERVRLLYCAKEENRAFVYSVIDRVCDNYATRHKVAFDKLSLAYIMNEYFNTSKADCENGYELDSEFCNLANSPDTKHLIDAFNVYPDFYINGRLRSVSIKGQKERVSTPADQPVRSIKLTDLIANAETRQDERSANTPSANRELGR